MKKISIEQFREINFCIDNHQILKVREILKNLEDSKEEDYFSRMQKAVIVLTK